MTDDMAQGMTYGCDLGIGQRLWLCNQGEQTQVTIASSNTGQQQQATQGVRTGQWTAPPQAFQTPGGLVVKLQTVTGQVFLQIQSGQIGFVEASAVEASSGAQPVPLQVEANAPVVQPMQPMTPMQPMQPMQPIQPMQMGNMSMSLNPMAMRMGDMEMRMGQPLNQPQNQAPNQAQNQAQQEYTSFAPPAPTVPPVPIPGSVSGPASSQASPQQFCSQCGSSVKPTDRFCTNCGVRLGS